MLNTPHNAQSNYAFSELQDYQFWDLTEIVPDDRIFLLVKFESDHPDWHIEIKNADIISKQDIFDAFLQNLLSLYATQETKYSVCVQVPNSSNKLGITEIVSRREFFRKIAQSTLPVIGAILVSNLPMTIKAMESHEASSYQVCLNNCLDSCIGDCSGRCKTTCSGYCSRECADFCISSCSGGCRTSCSGCGDQCSSSCQFTCKNSCVGCSGSCQNTCGGRCSYSCEGACVSLCSGSCVSSCSHQNSW